MLFSENKTKSSILAKLDSYNDDLQYVGTTKSPHRKQMLIPLGTCSQQNIEVPYEEKEYSRMPVVGTNQSLEKQYFRLTSAPDPADVRPEEVLRQSLKWISQKWKNRQNDYRWVDDQFRSMR